MYPCMQSAWWEVKKGRGCVYAYIYLIHTPIYTVHLLFQEAVSSFCLGFLANEKDHSSAVVLSVRKGVLSYIVTDAVYQL